jgi:hypothetical protein
MSMSEWLCMDAITLITGPLTIELCCLTVGVKLHRMSVVSQENEPMITLAHVCLVVFGV